VTRPQRDVRDDAKRVLAGALPHLGPGDPEYIALGLLTALDGARIGLTDLTPPEDPNAGYHRPPDHTIAPPPTTEDPTPGLAEYLAAKAERPKEVQP